MSWINSGPLGAGNLITDENGRPIAVTYGERTNPKSAEDTAKIAAAPDMLAALKMVLVVGLADEDGAATVEGEIYAAIAKAEGQS